MSDRLDILGRPPIMRPLPQTVEVHDADWRGETHLKVQPAKHGGLNMKDLSIPAIPSRHSQAATRRADILRRLNEGQTSAQIARRLGVSTSAICDDISRMKKQGVLL